MQKTVFDYINKTERPTAIDDERIRLADVYKRNGKPHSTEAEVDADILANFVGTKLLTDENAIRYVVGYKRSFGVWMREQITRLKAAFGSKNAKTQAFLDKAARLYHDALGESKNAVRSENGGKKNSIVYLDNGSSYVEASRQVISGNNHDKWISQIKRYFDELLIDSGELDIKTQEGDILTLTKKETKYKAWDSHKTVQGNRVPTDDSEFKVKLRAESHIDELAEASTRNGRELTPDKKNHTFAINGFSYRTAYFHDFDGKYYKVTISVGHNGTKATVYNVAQIKEDTLPTANILAVNGSKAVGKYPLKHSISETGENVNSSSKKSFSVSEAADDTAKAKPDKGQIVIVENALAKEEARRLNENAPGEYARAAEERRSIERAAVEEGIQEAQERENDPNLIVENALAKEESRRLNEKASAEYDRLLQEEYNKRQVLYSPDEGKSVKREDLKKVDKEYLERTERQLMNRLAQRMD